MSVFSIGMMSSTKTKSKKPKESALEIIHDGVVMAKLSSMPEAGSSFRKAKMSQSLSIPPKKITTSTENNSTTTMFKERHEKQYYVVADGIVFM
jgi:hypothetical protein